MNKNNIGSWPNLESRKRVELGRMSFVFPLNISK